MTTKIHATKIHPLNLKLKTEAHPECSVIWEKSGLILCEWKQYQHMSSRAQYDIDDSRIEQESNFCFLSFVSHQHKSTQMWRSVLLRIFSSKWTFGHAGQPYNFPCFLPNCLLGTFVSPFIFSDPPLIYLMDWSFYQRGLRIYPPQNYGNRVYVYIQLRLYDIVKTSQLPQFCLAELGNQYISGRTMPRKFSCFLLILLTEET